ncbi:MAG: PAS domain-containing protein [Desulfovibrionales bacterium]
MTDTIQKLQAQLTELQKEVKENKLFETGTRRDIEADLIVKSGQKIPYYFTGVRMIVEGKIYLLGVGIDLTEQKKTEEELRKSEEKYRTIFENAVEGIYQTTPGGQIICSSSYLI